MGIWFEKLISHKFLELIWLTVEVFSSRNCFEIIVRHAAKSKEKVYIVYTTVYVSTEFMLQIVNAH